MNRSDYISASEIGDFKYCKRSWWLKKKGLLPTTSEMLKGVENHENIFQQLLRIKMFQKILMWIGIVLLVLLLILLFLI